MKNSFAFSNLLGTVYRQGNVCFSPDGTYLLSPVGNKISAFDLVNNRTFTFPFETSNNIQHVAISPNGMLILVIDEDGRALLGHFHRKTVLHRMTFKSKVTAVAFSPCGNWISVALERKYLLQMWRTPLLGLRSSQPNEDEETVAKEFSPFVLARTYGGHSDKITRVCWSPDGKYIVTSSKDLTARVFTRDPTEGFKPLSLAGHRDTVIGAWWMEVDGVMKLVSVSHDCNCYVWTPIGEMETFKLEEKHQFNMKSEEGYIRLKSADFHHKTRLLCVGFTNGVFALYEMPNLTNIHQLSVSQKKLESIQFSPSSEWIAFASGKLGQLLVWEWQSETYVMKQQGHFYDMNCIAYSPDGQYLVTGGDDGKVKVWNSSNGFCFVTFTEHTAAVSAAEFCGKTGGKKSVVFTASLDGTVRAFDLLRFRNFRTFTSPEPVQFSSLAVDPSGEIVCAGSLDTFEIYVWSVQTGRLLDVLAGHEGPVVSLAFSPEGAVSNDAESSTLLVSGSWDKTVRVWNLFSRGDTSKCLETLQHKNEVLTVAFRPDGKEISAACLNGTVSFWDPIKGTPSPRLVELDVKRDIAGGRLASDRRTAKNKSNDKHFTTLCYSPDGNCLLGGGNSKWICLYDLQSGVLLKKFRISRNMALDGQFEKPNSRLMTEAGPLDEIDDEAEEFSDLEDRLALQNALPGATRGDLTKRTTRPMIRCKQLRFSNSGREWAIASTEGLIIYSLDDALEFDPFELDVEIKPSTVLELIQQGKKGNHGEFLKALIVALRLNEPYVLQVAYENIPVSVIDWVAGELPVVYLERVLRLITILLDRSLMSIRQGKEQYQNQNAVNFTRSPHLEFHLRFLDAIFRKHGKYIRSSKKNASASLPVVMRGLKKNLITLREDLSSVSNENLYTLRYLLQNKATDEEANVETLNDLLQ